jgi:hypothetical protein
MVHAVGRRKLKKRKEIHIKMDVKGIGFRVTDWFASESDPAAVVALA